MFPSKIDEFTGSPPAEDGSTGPVDHFQGVPLRGVHFANVTRATEL